MRAQPRCFLHDDVRPTIHQLIAEIGGPFDFLSSLMSEHIHNDGAALMRLEAWNIEHAFQACAITPEELIECAGEANATAFMETAREHGITLPWYAPSELHRRALAGRPLHILEIGMPSGLLEALKMDVWPHFRALPTALLLPHHAFSGVFTHLPGGQTSALSTGSTGSMVIRHYLENARPDYHPERHLVWDIVRCIRPDFEGSFRRYHMLLEDRDGPDADAVFRWYRKAAAHLGLWMGFQFTQEERGLLEMAKQLTYP